MNEEEARDLRLAIGATLLGETLGDGRGVDVTRVADLLIECLPRTGWTFARLEEAP